MLKVELNGTEKEYPYGTSLLEIAGEHQDKYENDILLALLNNRLVELNKPLRESGTLTFLTGEDEAGMNTYRRSAELLMIKAMYDITDKDTVDRLVVHFSLSKGLYCTIRGRKGVDEQFLNRMKGRMEELREQAVPIEKRSVHTREAVERFRKHGMEDKVRLLRYRRVSRLNVYNMDNLEDYFYGYMLPDASYIKYYDLFPYDEGFVLQLPSKRNPKQVPPFEPQNKLFQVMKESCEWGERQDLSTVGALNDRIAQGRISELILVQEALQEKKIAEIAQTVSSRPDVKLVMIAGPSSSGKTTFSHRLSVQLMAHGMRPHPIAVDNYFVDREDTPLDEFGQRDYECLGAIDVEGFNRDMNRLLAGETVEIPEFNFKKGKREYKGNYITLGKEDILVIEGIHCLNDALSYSLPKEKKFKIYISALTQLNIDEHNRIPTTDGRLIRRMVRDARTRGTSAKNTIAMWPSVRRGEERNIFPYQETADVMFNSALIYELAVLKQYAEPVLFGIGPQEPEYQEAKRLLKFLDYFIGIPSEEVPKNSLLREFLGGGCFKI
ncbi:MAG: nucleoside kinase [Lachnospiraceae bacterium]|nr:nucleoside kinase [Lachnospiraceae bacterium]MDD7023776.1 nucleoside kinase [Oscillospiraceae bacterium]